MNYFFAAFCFSSSFVTFCLHFAAFGLACNFGLTCYISTWKYWSAHYILKFVISAWCLSKKSNKKENCKLLAKRCVPKYSHVKWNYHLWINAEEKHSNSILLLLYFFFLSWEIWDFPNQKCSCIETIVKLSIHRHGRGGTHMLGHTGMRLPNGLLFHQKSLGMGPILVLKRCIEEGPISQKLSKTYKISLSWGRKPLRNGSRYAKILKNSQNSHFLRGKNPEMWVGVSDLWQYTRSKNNSSTIPGRHVAVNKSSAKFLCLMNINSHWNKNRFLISAKEGYCRSMNMRIYQCLLYLYVMIAAV